jgi:NAD(P)-dependent dehydrogenase (short-subunit alcohol dehydrogenase family)
LIFYPSYLLAFKFFLVSVALFQEVTMLTGNCTSVFCMDRLESPDPEFEAARDGAKSDNGGSLHYLRIDVRDSVNVQNTIREIAAESGRLDGMICAAAVNHVQSAIEHSQSAMDEVMHINYNGVFNSATAAAKQMFHYKSPGSILLAASMSGLIANKGMTSPVYNSSKAAVIQLGRPGAVSPWNGAGTAFE